MRLWGGASVKAVSATLTSPSGRPLTYADLGDDFFRRLGPSESPDTPVRFELEAGQSKAGNTYYSWDLNGIPLPDGFATGVKLLGSDIPLSVPRESKNGNMMADGRANVMIHGELYVAHAVIVRTRKPYWVKVIAHVRPGRRKSP